MSKERDLGNKRHVLFPVAHKEPVKGSTCRTDDADPRKKCSSFHFFHNLYINSSRGKGKPSLYERVM